MSIFLETSIPQSIGRPPHAGIHGWIFTGASIVRPRECGGIFGGGRRPRGWDLAWGGSGWEFSEMPRSVQSHFRGPRAGIFLETFKGGRVGTTSPGK